MSDVSWLSYTELAERLGSGRQSARQLAIRRRWMRKPGNDGQARVAVPLEALTRPDTRKPTSPETCPEAGRDTRSEQPPALPATPPVTPSDDTPLLVTIGRLEERIEGLNRLLNESARERDELRQERDRWAAQAERVALTAPQPVPAQAAPVQPRGWWLWKRSA